MEIPPEPSPQLKKLILRNFKSVPFASIDFSNMNFIVGRNGSGKSNISDALAFLSEAMEIPLQSVINRRGGAHNVAHRDPIVVRSPPRPMNRPVPMAFAVEFQNLGYQPYYGGKIVISGRYALQITTTRIGFSVEREQCSISFEDGEKTWFDRIGGKIYSSVNYLTNFSEDAISRDSLFIQIVSGLGDFSTLVRAIKSMAVYAIEPSTLREFQNHDPGNRLLPDGSNAASVLKYLASNSPGKFRRLLEILSAIIPDLEEIRSVSVGRKQSLRFYQAWGDKENRERMFFDAFNMSDGTLRSLGILLAVFQEPSPSVILVEEPETSIHPGAVGAILELLRSVSPSMQVVVTTHSPEVLDYANYDDVIKVVTWNRGSTRVDGVYGAAHEALRQHLSGPGELFRMRLLDAPSLFDEKSSYEPIFEEFR